MARLSFLMNQDPFLKGAGLEVNRPARNHACDPGSSFYMSPGFMNDDLITGFDSKGPSSLGINLRYRAVIERGAVGRNRSRGMSVRTLQAQGIQFVRRVSKYFACAGVDRSYLLRNSP